MANAKKTTAAAKADAKKVETKVAPAKKEEAVKAPAKAVEAKKEEVKAAPAKKEEVKATPAKKETVKAAPAKKETVKKEAPKAEKKAPAKKAEAKVEKTTNIFVEFNGVQYDITDVEKKVTKAIGRKKATEVNIYVNAEGKAYYTIDGKGSEELFVEL